MKTDDQVFIGLLLAFMIILMIATLPSDSQPPDYTDTDTPCYAMSAC